MPCSPDLLDFPLHFLCCFRRRPLPHFVECPQPALSLLFAERTGKRLQVFHGIFNDLAGRFVQKSGKPFDSLNRLLVERERNFSCHSDYPNHFATARNPRSIKLISRGSSYSNSAPMSASFRRAGRVGAEAAAGRVAIFFMSSIDSAAPQWAHVESWARSIDAPQFAQWIVCTF